MKQYHPYTPSKVGIILAALSILFGWFIVITNYTTDGVGILFDGGVKQSTFALIYLPTINLASGAFILWIESHYLPRFYEKLYYESLPLFHSQPRTILPAEVKDNKGGDRGQS